MNDRAITRQNVLHFALFFLLLLGACGGDDNGGGSGTPPVFLLHLLLPMLPIKRPITSRHS